LLGPLDWIASRRVVCICTRSRATWECVCIFEAGWIFGDLASCSMSSWLGSLHLRRIARTHRDTHTQCSTQSRLHHNSIPELWRQVLPWQLRQGLFKTYHVGCSFVKWNWRCPQITASCQRTKARRALIARSRWAIRSFLPPWRGSACARFQAWNN
jgi:hypothetical protein